MEQEVSYIEKIRSITTTNKKLAVKRLECDLYDAIEKEASQGKNYMRFDVHVYDYLPGIHMIVSELKEQGFTVRDFNEWDEALYLQW